MNDYVLNIFLPISVSYDHNNANWQTTTKPQWYNTIACIAHMAGAS